MRVMKIRAQLKNKRSVQLILSRFNIRLYLINKDLVVVINLNITFKKVLTMVNGYTGQF